MLRFLFIIASLNFALCTEVLAQSRNKKSSSFVDGWTLGGSVFYPVSGRKFEFSGKRTSNNQKITATFEFEPQPSISIFVKRSNENSFGFLLGYESVLPSKLNGGTVRVGTTSNSAKSHTHLEEVTFGIIQIGTEYRWSQFYIPARFLYLLPNSLKTKSGSMGGTHGAASGYSFGLGYLINSNLFTEMSYRNIGFRYSENLTMNGNTKDDYTTGFSKEITVSLGVMM